MEVADWATIGVMVTLGGLLWRQIAALGGLLWRQIAALDTGRRIGRQVSQLW